ncbi:MAG TPA: NTP transferase domain-containing protein [Candidatus Saccharimonadales bacterium]|nr:NTP transferase domain-containing protein [Candidatus Saccharimonadales bacterium]
MSTPKDSRGIDNLSGYINAGGRGTRLSSIFSPHERRGVSKALLPLGDPPISLVEHQINKLNQAGISIIVAGVGDHENVADYVQEKYTREDHIHALRYSEQLGNGGDLVRAVRDRSDLFKDNVLVICVDVLLDIDEVEFMKSHQTQSADLTIALTQNRGVPNENAYYVGDAGQVIFCHEVADNVISEEAAAARSLYRGSSTGALIVKKEVLSNLSWQPEDGPLPLYSKIVGDTLARNTLFAYDNGSRLFTDVGTVGSWNDLQANQNEITSYICY